jgi:hypothetical protein
MSMKNSNDTTRNQTHNLPACSTVPQPTAPPCAPMMTVMNINLPYFSMQITLKAIKENKNG